MVRQIVIILAVLSTLLGSVAFSEELGYISFKDAERLAIENSPQILAQGYVTDSAYSQADSQKVKRYPNLSLSAQSMFVSQIGKATIPTLGTSMDIGSHTNWSVTPSLNFIVWDTGQIINKARSLRKSADAQGNQLDYDKRQVLLGARSAYIDVQLAKEQVRLVKDALALARAQYAYVLAKYKVGTSDKLDLTVAHQEVSDRERDLEQTEGELFVSKRAFVAALGIEDEIENAKAVEVEPVKTTLNLLLPRAYTPFDANSHPEVKALANKSESSTFAAKSSVAQYFPEITLQGSAGYQYPNLGQNVTVQQNQLTLGLNMPIFDWGSIWKATKSQKYQARAASEQKRQTIIELTRDVSETRDWIDTYKRMQTADANAVRDAVETAKLSYESFQIGKIIFLDVQRANVNALAAKVDAARNDANLAVSVAKLLALAVDEGK